MNVRLRHNVYYIKERKHNLRMITMCLMIYDRVAATCSQTRCNFLTFLVFVEVCSVFFYLLPKHEFYVA